MTFQEHKWYTEMPRGSHFGWITIAYPDQGYGEIRETFFGFYRSWEKKWEILLGKDDFLMDENYRVVAWMPVKMPAAFEHEKGEYHEQD